MEFIPVLKTGNYSANPAYTFGGTSIENIEIKLRENEICFDKSAETERLSDHPSINLPVA